MTSEDSALYVFSCRETTTTKSHSLGRNIRVLIPEGKPDCNVSLIATNWCKVQCQSKVESESAFLNCYQDPVTENFFLLSRQPTKSYVTASYLLENCMSSSLTCCLNYNSPSVKQHQSLCSEVALLPSSTELFSPTRVSSTKESSESSISA